MDEQELPIGFVTFVLTDVEDSTGHWGRPGAPTAMARQRELIASVVGRLGGRQPLEQGEGDSTVSVFADPADGLAATIAIQQALAAEPWPAAPVRVRIGVHTGRAELVDDRTYGGHGIIRCARVRDLAGGGQVLVSSATAAVLQDDLVDPVRLRELATVALKGLDRPERLFQVQHPDLERGSPVVRPAPDRGGLPSYATRFVGHEAEIRQVRELLDGEAALVTVTGSAGSGKTRFAHQVALAGADDFGGGVVWVDLTRVDAGSRVASEVAAACGLAESPGGVDATSMVASHLHANRRLVVLDNCEHVLDGAATLAEAVVGRGGPSALLATSREPIGVAGETVWRIPSLPCRGAALGLEAVRSLSAVELFRDRAQLGRPSFEVDAGTADAVLAICERLDGIPLAIELAAARLRTMSLADVVNGLDDRFRLLTGGGRSLERQRTLQGSLDWSHELLDSAEQVLFRRLGVFASPFGWAAAETVAADDCLDRCEVFEILQRLVDKSLVVHDARGYSMLETIRQYASQKVVDAGEMAPLRQRHLQWFLEQTSRWGFDRGPVAVEVFDEAELVLPDLHAALELARSDDRTAAARLLYPIGDVAGARMRYRELDDLGRHVCGREDEGTLAWAELFSPLSRWVPWAVTDWWVTSTRSLLEDGALSPRLRNRLEFALLYIDLLDGTDGVSARAEDLLAAGRADLDDVLVAFAGANLALAAAVNGDLGRAERTLAWSERHFPDDLVQAPFCHAARLFLCLMEGEVATAAELIARRQTDFVRPHPVYLAEALVAILTRDLSRLRSIEAEMSRVEFSGFGQFIPDQVRFWRALVEKQDLDEAYTHLDAMTSQVTLVAHSGYVWAAELALANGDLDLAEAHAAQAAHVCAGREMPFLECSTRLVAAEIAHARDEPRQARALAHQALELAESHRVRLSSVSVLELLAVIAGNADDVERTGRLVGACDAFRSRSGCVGRWPYLEAHLAVLRTGLPDSALEEGAALSIDDAAVIARGPRGPRGRPTFGWESLTPAEARVVELAAVGLSNKQIADQLFVSVATVKTHVVHVYRKLGFTTRAELIAATLTALDRRPPPPEQLRHEAREGRVAPGGAFTRDHTVPEAQTVRNGLRPGSDL